MNWEDRDWMNLMDSADRDTMSTAPETQVDVVVTVQGTYTLKEAQDLPGLCGTTVILQCHGFLSL